MIITGKPGASLELLRAAIVDIPGASLSWGVNSLPALNQLERFKANNIPTIEFTSNLREAQEWVRNGKIVIGRSSRHTQGFDICRANLQVSNRRRYCNNEYWSPRWLRKDFWAIWEDSIAEYRQHVAFGFAIRSQKKIQVNPDLADPHFPAIRSRRLGWHMDAGVWTRPRSLQATGKAVMASVGYTFGAVDIIQKASGELLVLEVNAAPSLKDEGTLAAYVQAIRRHAKREGRIR
jgi:hypothetical protein